MKALDLFCGLGGWSDGLALEGFKVLGVEINWRIAQLYKYRGKHEVIVKDVRNLNPLNFIGYDLIVGSPPCREFSSFANFAYERIKRNQPGQWKKPPNIETGLELVYCFLNFVEKAKPKYWLMENVPNLEKYIGKPIVRRAHIGKTMFRSFWGNFPAFLIPMDLSKKPIQKTTQNRFRKWERAKIPLPVARALGKACASIERLE